MRAAPLIALVVVAGVVPAGAGNVHGDPEPVLAVISSGVRATHEAFAYGGPADPDDQLVGWWDFTGTEPRLPEPGQRWDPVVPDPYDDATGVGTAAAALAVGTPSQGLAPAAPGVALAVARVDYGPATSPPTFAAAIRWASDTIGADVILLAHVDEFPEVDLLGDVPAAIREARRAGAVVVTGNGDGSVRSPSVPKPGWTHRGASAPHVLAVAATGPGTRPSLDPHLAAPGAELPTADSIADDAYYGRTGSPFAAATVAGAAVDAIRIAEANGRDPAPADIEALVKRVARDTTAPPHAEGYGILDVTDDEQMGLLRTHAAAGTLPPRPDPDPSATYVESGAHQIRRTNADRLDLVRHLIPVPGLPPGTGPFVLGTGAPGLVGEGETFSVELARGERIDVALVPERGESLVDGYLFEGTGPAFAVTDAVARTSVTGERTITFRAHRAGRYTLVVIGRFGIDRFATLPYLMVATTTDPGTPDPAFAGESIYLTTTTTLDVI